MKAFPAIFLCLLLAGNMQAQDDTAAQNDTLGWFDFWLGDWDLMWYEDSASVYGTNHVEKILTSKVISENFSSSPESSTTYAGKSYSVFDQITRQWKQTWVDTDGSYLDFYGEKEGDRFFFERKITNMAGLPVIQRMVFRDITTSSFTWDWKTSVDEGKTWKTQWQIFYTRKEKKCAIPPVLAGTWVMPASFGNLYENWRAQDDSTLVGRGYTLSGSDTIVSEYLLLTCRAGNMYYTPTTMGQNNQQPVVFKHTGSFENGFIFENPDHDFPQQITYTILPDNKLEVKISGNKGGKLKQYVYSFTRY